MSVSTPSESLKIKIKSSSRKKKDSDIFTPIIITRNVSLPIINIGNNIDETLNDIIVNEIEGRCIVEGYIKTDSVKILTYSSGLVTGSNIKFEVMIECLVCNPVEGMIIPCIAINITKAGIRAQYSETNNPLVIFIARDHNYTLKNFSLIEEKQEIKIRVIGQRFELNDQYISIIGELVDSKLKSKPKIKILSPQKESISIPHTNISEPSLVKSPTAEAVLVEPSLVKSPTAEAAPDEPSLVKSPTAEVTPSKPSLVKSPTAEVTPGKPSLVKSPTAEVTPGEPSLVKSPTAEVTPGKPSLVKSPTAEVTPGEPTQ